MRLKRKINSMNYNYGLGIVGRVELKLGIIHTAYSQPVDLIMFILFSSKRDENYRVGELIDNVHIVSTIWATDAS